MSIGCVVITPCFELLAFWVTRAHKKATRFTELGWPFAHLRISCLLLVFQKFSELIAKFGRVTVSVTGNRVLHGRLHDFILGPRDGQAAIFLTGKLPTIGYFSSTV